MAKTKNDTGEVTQWMEALAAETILDAKLAHARELQERIDHLRMEHDRILSPIIQQAITDDDPTNTMAMLKKLPRGFHRTELRRHHVKRVEDSEYRR